jgi:hypothetical protein
VDIFAKIRPEIPLRFMAKSLGQSVLNTMGRNTVGKTNFLQVFLTAAQFVF